MSLFPAYRAERNSGKTHAQIVEDGIFGSLADEFALRYSQEIATYQDYMNRRVNCECDLDVFGNRLKAGR